MNVHSIQVAAKDHVPFHLIHIGVQHVRFDHSADIMEGDLVLNLPPRIYRVASGIAEYKEEGRPVVGFGRNQLLLKINKTILFLFCLRHRFIDCGFIHSMPPETVNEFFNIQLSFQSS